MVNIKKLRTKVGMTQNELAAAIGVSGQLISNIERRVAQVPFGRMRKMAEALDVDVELLVNDRVIKYRQRLMRSLK